MSLPSDINKDPDRRESAVRFLYGRIDYERARNVPYRDREFKLARMSELVDRIGNPQNGMTIIHVAGTKGKGSTAAMIGAVLTASGRRVGVYTSPHLDRIEERLAVDGRPCTSTELADLVDRVRPALKVMDREAAACGPPEIGPTYFEIATAMALLHFAECNVDAAVLEVGLGGRLDSTNVCRPSVCVITSISLDHTRQLGNTPQSVAREKAGIIKPGVPVVSGVTDPRPRDVIREICTERGCRLVELGVDFDFDYRSPRRLESTPTMGKIDFRHWGTDRRHEHRDVSLGLLGHHQAVNAAVALATLVEVGQSGWNISESAIRAGLADVVWPARVELLARRPAVIVDSAHNVASIDATIRVLTESFTVGRRLLVFATTQEKDVRGMLARLVGRFDHLIFTRYLDNPRAIPPEQLAAIASELGARQYEVCDRPSAAWNAASRLAAPDDLICVTGSFFIAAEIRRQVRASLGIDGTAGPKR